jgi:2-amino-4-hydroxy-6-hydroxymethyldihydropteridine diphosphokinase
VILGLGGNVGDEAAIVGRFQAVVDAFAAWGPVRTSPVYRSAPIGPAQPDFLNMAIAVRADPEPTPDELISMVLTTERMLGRDRRFEARWGPRTIDIDVLLWGDRVGRWEGLEVPHPRLRERRFALEPVAYLIGGSSTVPGTVDTIDQLLAAVAHQRLTCSSAEVRGRPGGSDATKVRP